MYSKLAFRSVKRSLGDYAIYFLTLMVGVCLFYTFNCLNEQQVMLDLTASHKEMMGMLEQSTTMVSVFVSVILGFLCLFANQFLMKRRKKELGLYMTLGMSKKNISHILILETVFVAVLSLGAGLLLGGIVSQGMAVLTASLFEVAIIGYSFVFSVSAMMKTIVFFVIIFLVVMIFNTVIVSRYQLIDLLKSSKKNEKLKVTNTLVSGILFSISILLIIGGYLLLSTIGLSKGFTVLGIGIGIILIGTFMFYFTGSNFILTVLQKSKGFYFKGTRMFVLRQFHSKVNTSFLSMTIISLMLFFTMAILSTGFSYKHSVEKDLERISPYDATLQISPWDVQNSDYEQVLKNYGIDLNKYGNYISIETYYTDLDSIKTFLPFATGEIKSSMEKGFPYLLRIISYSDYTKLAKFYGITPSKLGADETLILSNMNTAFDTIENFISNTDMITINTMPLKVCKKGYEILSLEDENIGRNFACFVVPDELTTGLDSMGAIYNIDYTMDPSIANQELAELAAKMLLPDSEFFNSGITIMTKDMAYIQVAGETTSYIYIGIYMGLVFLIATGAVLALQLLSEASDSEPRYKALKRIGATEKQIKRAILTQVSLYFITPLILAISHAAFTVYFVNAHLVYSTNNLVIPAVFTICIFLLLYGGYLLATYTSYKRIVK